MTDHVFDCTVFLMLRRLRDQFDPQRSVNTVDSIKAWLCVWAQGFVEHFAGDVAQSGGQ